MRLQTLSVQNFRGLENINITFNSTADVIVGPNAVGKTTILEAIRLTKAILAPRTRDEGQQALISVGAVSPHVPQHLNFAALVRDEKRPLTIKCKFELAQSELDSLDGIIPIIANTIVQSNLGLEAQSPIALVQFLSTPQGQAAHNQARTQASLALTPIKTARTLILNLTIDPVAKSVTGNDQMAQIVFSSLEGQLPPHQSLFSYFPADRAMPTGDVNIQLGGPEVTAQLQAHNANPQTKYQRLKQTILSSYLLNPSNPTEILEDFKTIFSNLMKDREIEGLRTTTFGLVSIRVKDLITNRDFDIDNMSSGEKGLILTFLLISRGVARNGIILIDEPELHLNPAVCKILLPFLIEQYLVPKNIQAIICSHAPEILGVAFDRSDCSLHHLQSPTVISPILPKDKREVFEALRRLGTSTSDVLFSNGSIFLEGDDDVEILAAGFDKILARYNVTQLGGRRNVEEDIRTLQEAESKGEIDTLKCFIFDLDNAPTELKSTALIRVNQWKRNCIENYLINEEAIYDLLRDDDISADDIEKRGEVGQIFKGIALSQLTDTVANDVYKRTVFENVGMPPRRDLVGKTINECAKFLFNRISKLKGQVESLNIDSWCAEFEKQCDEARVKLLPRWEIEWITLCDGKRFFFDLHKRFHVKVSPRKLKVRIMERMARDHSDDWAVMESLLRDVLKP